MSTTPRPVRRSAVLAPLVLAGLVATATPASAIPFEGDPQPGTTCLRLEPLAGAGAAGSPLFVSFGLVLVLAGGAGCSAAAS